MPMIPMHMYWSYIIAARQFKWTEPTNPEGRLGEDGITLSVLLEGSIQYVSLT